MTPSEAWVYKLCQQSFLSPWSYPRPLRSNGRELCDVLVFCEPDIVVFSVKEIELGDSGDPAVDWGRWQRKAIDASAKQLYGAARELTKLKHVTQESGARGLALPKVEERRVHLVAVAAGGRREVPVYSGDFGKGHVHVFDEVSLPAVLQELDTIGDFVAYLTAMRRFHASGGGAMISGGEEHLLALYLHRGRTLPEDADMLIVEDDLWTKLQEKPEWRKRKEDDRVSYMWDQLIEKLFDDHAVPLRAGSDVSEPERIVRTMARENRLARRVLGGSFLGWLQRMQAGARMVRSPTSDVVYVFLTTPRDWQRRDRVAELKGRCLVARSLHRDCATVVGIGTEIYDPAGYSLDTVYLHMPTWTDEDEQHARYAREEFDWFNTPEIRHVGMDEFPIAEQRCPAASSASDDD